MVTTENSTSHDLILEHGLISLKELQDNINAAYWTGIEDRTIPDQSSKQIQMNLRDNIIYHHINGSITTQVKKKICGMSDKWTRKNGSHSGLIFLK